MNFKILQNIVSFVQPLVNILNPLRLFERKFISKAQNLEDPIFIVGAPRSGSTLLYQMIVSHYKVDFISNFVSLLYSSPALSNLVGKKLFKESGEKFSSNYGFVSGILSPSEGKKMIDRFFLSGEIDTTKKTLGKMLSDKDYKFIFKNLKLSLKIKSIGKSFNNPFFIYIKRKPEFNLQSILQSKKELYGEDSRNHWFSYEVPEKEEIMQEKDDIKQIALQLKAIDRHISSQLKSISQNNFLVVEYGDLVTNPKKILKEIQNKTGLKLRPDKSLDDLSKQIRNSNKIKVSKEEWSKIKQEIV